MDWHFSRSPASESSDVSASRLLDALADARRRDVLRTVAAQERVSVDRLAAAVESPESGCSRSRTPNVHLRLVHADLPKLADANLVAVDPASTRVSIRPWPPLVETVLEAVDDGATD